MEQVPSNYHIQHTNLITQNEIGLQRLRKFQLFDFAHIQVECFVYGRCRESRALFHTACSTSGRCAADNFATREHFPIDAQNRPLDGGLPSPRAARDNTDRRGQRHFDRVPLLRGKDDPHLSLQSVNFIIQIPHIGQFILREHPHDAGGSPSLRLSHDRAVGVVTI